MGVWGGNTVGIRLQNNPNPQELDRTPRLGVENLILFIILYNKFDGPPKGFLRPRFLPMGGNLDNNFYEIV